MVEDITPNIYLQAAFPPDMIHSDERPVVAFPASFISSKTGKRVDYYRQLHPADRMTFDARSWYVCLSTVQRQYSRQVKKRLEDVRRAFVFAIDDVYTKSKAPNVRPSCVLETSPGNYQWHYFIEPYDVSTPEGQAYFDACLWSMAQAGFNDPGFRSASRLARLPRSMHKSGFSARVAEWAPLRSWDLPLLMDELGVPVEPHRKPQALTVGAHTRLAAVEDPVYHWLADNWEIYGHNDQWVFIECPWRGSHTDCAQGHSSTAYSPDEYGRKEAAFKCLHGHCAERTVTEFKNWVLAKSNHLLAGALAGYKLKTGA